MVNHDYIAYGYALLVAGGGVMGFVKSGSVPSMAAGLLFGSILMYGAYQTSQNPNNYLVQLAASGILAGVMGSRYFNTGKLMPAGLVAAISAGMVCRYVFRSFSQTAAVDK